MMEILGLLVGVMGLAFGLWQRQKSSEAEAQLRDEIDGIPDRVAQQVSDIIGGGNDGRDASDRDEAPWPVNVVNYADVDHDGDDELLIQYVVGAHGMALKVFGWEDGDLTEMGEFGSTSAGIEVKDYDDDGRLEIVTRQADYSTRLPYSDAPSFYEVYRWENGEFQHVDTVRDYTEEDVREMERQFYEKECDNSV